MNRSPRQTSTRNGLSIEAAICQVAGTSPCQKSKRGVIIAGFYDGQGEPRATVGSCNAPPAGIGCSGSDNVPSERSRDMMPKYAINMWPGWSDVLVRGEKYIENRSYGASRWDRVGGLPLRVFVYATGRSRFDQWQSVANILDRDIADVFWRPWATSAIVGMVTVAAELGTDHDDEICAEHLPGVPVSKIWRWASQGSHWYLIKDPIQFKRPIAWQSRQSAPAVEVPEWMRQTAETIEHGEPDWTSVCRPCWQCVNRATSDQRSSDVYMTEIGDMFRCRSCDASWRIDGSENAVGRSRFLARCLPHDYRAVPYPNMRAHVARLRTEHASAK